MEILTWQHTMLFKDSALYLQNFMLPVRLLSDFLTSSANDPSINIEVEKEGHITLGEFCLNVCFHI